MVVECYRSAVDCIVANTVLSIPRIMKHLILLACITLSALLAPAVRAELPDPAKFSVQLEMGDVAQARAWLDEGLDPNFEGAVIGTGLMIGAWEGNIPMMELFLARGADIQRTNRFGETALMLAAWKNRREAMHWLLQRGAQPNREYREWTALHYAAFSGNGDLVDDLVGVGADVNARSTNGSTVVMMAAREGHEAVAQRLLAAGANPLLKNDFDEDAVKWAMKQGNYDIAKSFTSAENFAALAREAANWRPPVRSIPAPDAVEEHLRMARLAEARGKRDEALAAYRRALAVLKAQDAKEAAGKTKVGADGTAGKSAKAPSSLVIRARRDEPASQTMGFAYDQGSAQNSAESSVDRLLEQARAAEARGQPKEAMRLYKEVSARLRATPPR